ncbi:MAG TPA: ribosome assembly RNA-binding protein YhbY [Firmicutes bacterium]|nr:RNA-binding protein [uncultured bacterium]HHW98082.1 ribosome assembly RNA-binding protein YhbY [Bacillota bacterium]
MISSKQRSFLRGLANPLEPIFQIGKGGLGEGVFAALDDALTARELIKVRVLKSTFEEPRDIAARLAEGLKADVVQVIGQNIILYRPNKEEPKITLP